MRRLGIMLLSALVGVIGRPVSADTEVKVHGQVRARTQLDKKSFDSSAVTVNFCELRTRVGVEATVDGNAHAFIQLQDSRISGEMDQFGQASSGSLNDGKNVDLHQAYMRLDRVFMDGVGAKIGRFEFVQGNERIFGAVGWSNVGRAWDGGMLWYRQPEWQVTGFWLKKLELMDANENRDFDIFGVYVTTNKFENNRIDLFGFYEYNADTVPVVAGDNLLNRGNIGFYYKGIFDAVDVEACGAVQLGTIPKDPLAADTTELDISAFMLAAEAGYTFPGPAKARLAAGIDYSSGDNNPDDNKYKTYENAYYTGHKFRGYMDYFVTSDSAGLVDLMLRGRVDPLKGWTLKGDFHFFQTAQDYASPIDGSATKDVGIEIDLALSTVAVTGVTLDAGVSAFFPQDAFAGFTNTDPGVWGWGMATINFGN